MRDMPRLSITAALVIGIALFSGSAVSDTPPAVKYKAVNPEDLRHYDRVVMVPTAYVTLQVKGHAFAAKQSSGLLSMGGGSGASAKASADYKATGVDAELAMSIAKAAYDDLIKQLRDAGYTVLTYEDIKARPEIQAMQRETLVGGLLNRSEGRNEFVVAAPSAEQHFKTAMAWGVFNQFSGGRGSKIKDATVLIPQFTFIAPQVWVETGSGYKSVSAEVKREPGMTLASASVAWLGKPVSRMMRGIPGVTMEGQRYDLSQSVGTLNQTNSTSSSSTGKGLGRLFGTGSMASAGADFELIVDRAAYSQAAVGAIQRFNAEVARVARDAKP